MYHFKGGVGLPEHVQAGLGGKQAALGPTWLGKTLDTGESAWTQGKAHGNANIHMERTL